MGVVEWQQNSTVLILLPFYCSHSTAPIPLLPFYYHSTTHILLLPFYYYSHSTAPILLNTLYYSHSTAPVLLLLLNISICIMGALEWEHQNGQSFGTSNHFIAERLSTRQLILQCCRLAFVCRVWFCILGGSGVRMSKVGKNFPVEYATRCV